MGNNEPGLMLYPGETGEGGTQDINAQKKEESREPPGGINEMLRRPGGIARFYDGSRRQKDRQKE
jgi:hypothetical protein